MIVGPACPGRCGWRRVGPRTAGLRHPPGATRSSLLVTPDHGVVSSPLRPFPGAILPSLQRDEDAMAQRPVDGLGQMPLAPGVLDEDHLPGADAARLAVARGELDARVEIDDVLAPRGGMPVEVVVGRHFAEDDPRGQKARRQPPGAGRLRELHLQVLEMRLALLVRVEPVDLHGTASCASYPVPRGGAPLIAVVE